MGSAFGIHTVEKMPVKRRTILNEGMEALTLERQDTKPHCQVKEHLDEMTR